MADVTQILNQIQQGDAAAADELLPLVYDELRQLAAARLAAEKPGHTLQATALVHEAYLRLLGDGPGPDWNGRGHFFGAAAEAMRRILIESARRKQRLKHGGGRRAVALENLQLDIQSPPEELIELDEALSELESAMPEVGQVVQLRFFAGLTVEQAASAIGISPRTARRHWSYARAWLFRRMEGNDENS